MNVLLKHQRLCRPALFVSIHVFGLKPLNEETELTLGLNASLKNLPFLEFFHYFVLSSLIPSILSSTKILLLVPKHFARVLLYIPTSSPLPITSSWLSF